MMSKEEFERVFKECYNPSITRFKEEDGESWNDLAPDFAEKCNCTDEDLQRGRCNASRVCSTQLNTISRCPTMPYCNSCGVWNPEGSAYCSGCGSALADATDKYRFPGAVDAEQPVAAGDPTPTAEEAIVRSRVIGAVLLAASLALAVYGTFFLQMSVESMSFEYDLPFDRATAYELLSGGAEGFSGAIPNAVLVLFVIGGIACTAAGFLHSAVSRVGAVMIIIGTFMTFILSYPLELPEGTVHVDIFINIFPHSPLMMVSFLLAVVASHFTSTAERLKKRAGQADRQC